MDSLLHRKLSIGLYSGEIDKHHSISARTL